MISFMLMSDGDVEELPYIKLSNQSPKNVEVCFGERF